MRKKKKNLKIETKEKKTRAKYQCPDEVNFWLVFMKEFIPPEFNPPEWYYERDISNKFYRPEYNSIPCDSDEDTKFFYEKMSAFINNEIGDMKYPMWAMAWKYLELEPTHSNLPTMDEIVLNNKYKSISFYLGVLVSYYRIAQAAIEICRHLALFFEKVRKGELPKDSKVLFNVPTAASITNKDEIFIENDLKFLNAFNSIAFDRLRACEICNHIFWAKYKNSFTCSKPCLNALRQRRHRKTNKESINEKRRANYQYKKINN